MSSSIAQLYGNGRWYPRTGIHHRQFRRPRPSEMAAALVTRVRNGELSAFEEIVHRYTPKLYRSLMAITGNTQDAEDGVQNAFLKAYENLGDFKGRSVFATWLTRIAINEGLQILRRRRPLASLEALDAEESSEWRLKQSNDWGDPEQFCSRRELQAQVEKALLKLPVKYRLVVVLRDIEQLSTDETASVLGLGTPALKARLLRGRLMLRKALEPFLTPPTVRHFAPVIRTRTSSRI